MMKRLFPLSLFLFLLWTAASSQLFESKQTLYSTNEVLQGWYTESCYTPVASYEGATYFVFLDATRKPMIGKYENGSTTIEPLTKDFPDYRARDDGHHEFSLGIDKEGYIHVCGDMHNHPQAANSHLPSAMESSNILYWKSSQPGDITSFDFMGSTAGTISGIGWSYGKFDVDRNGELYWSARTVARQWYYQKDSKGAGRGFGIYKYNTSSKTWTALGALPDVSDAGYPVVVWEPSAKLNESYQQYKGSIFFDPDNRLHLAVALNSQFGPTSGNTAIYAYSDDGGETFRKMDGTPVALPMKTEAGPNQCDVVSFDLDGSLDQAEVVAAFNGYPVVQYRLNGTGFYTYWDGFSWSPPQNSPVTNRGRLLFNEHTDELLFVNIQNGTIYGKTTFTSGNSTYDAGQTFRYFDEITFAQKNVLIGLSWWASGGTLELIELAGVGANDNLDCADIPNGTAYLDGCDKCVGGTTGQVPCDRAPFGGSPHPIPGVIEAEEYDEGANTVTHYDLTPGNTGGEFRADDVDIQEAEGITGTYHVGWVEEGEWLEYTIDVQTSGDYAVFFRVASETGADGFSLELDNVEMIPTTAVSSTGGWQVYEELDLGMIALTEGEHVLRLNFAGSAMNLDHMQFDLVTGTSLDFSNGGIEIFPNPVIDSQVQVRIPYREPGPG